MIEILVFFIALILPYKKCHSTLRPNLLDNLLEGFDGLSAAHKIAMVENDLRLRLDAHRLVSSFFRAKLIGVVSVLQHVTCLRSVESRYHPCRGNHCRRAENAVRPADLGCRIETVHFGADLSVLNSRCPGQGNGLEPS
jgi:hypothetical protein